MQPEYDFGTIERQKQEEWAHTQAFVTDNIQRNTPARYMLSMFPYPSGKLHMGHVRNYTISDVLSRHYRQKGFEVMQPMGWDAFGLPAENAAIAHGVSPHKWTHDNIAHMKDQLNALGLSIDWSREFATCDPEYYKWEQWLFLRLYKKGLVYKKCASVNWDPVDQTVLANEQVIDGRGWRSGALVEKRDVPMYYYKITQYADELLDDLKTLEGNWPKQVLAMQSNWIGKSQGATVAFAYQAREETGDLVVFTTRPDTLLGATYLAISYEHPLAQKAAADDAVLSDFIAACKLGSVAEADLAKAEKTGRPTPYTATHPLTGEALPIWVANYVLMSYGTGAVMAVPAHDARDFDFAKKYNLPMRPVIEVGEFNPDAWRDAYAERGQTKALGMHLGVSFDHLDFDGVLDALLQAAPDRIKKTTQYRLRDWGVSRQRYWGCPIPMIHCPNCGDVCVPEADLPVVLPTDVVPDGRGNPLIKCESFINVTCPECGGAAKRETDTFDTFMESSWYAQRFASPFDDSQMVSQDGANKWLPVYQYVGGVEHAVLHLLYARFFHKVMRDEGLVNGDEPFARLFAQGMVLAGTFYTQNDDGSKRYYFANEIDTKDGIARLKSTGEEVITGKIEKMSKSKNNGVDPAETIAEYGADVVRLYTLFTAPADQTLEWIDSGLKGPAGFLKKLWRAVYAHKTQAGADVLNQTLPLVFEHTLSKPQKILRKKTHETIAKIDESLSNLAMNTPVSDMMALLNAITAFNDTSDTGARIRHEALLSLLILLAPYAPHISEYLLKVLGADASVFPPIDETALVEDEILLVVQVNGKVRGEIVVNADTTKDAILAQAKAQPSVQKYLNGTLKKEILVPGKLVSLVVG